MADWTSSVRSSLRELLLTVSNLPPVHYEGRIYQPTVGQQWLREHLLPVASPVATLGTSGSVREEFIYRLTLFSPISASFRLTDHENMVDAIRAKFFPGQAVTDSGNRYRGTVTEVARGYSIQEPDWLSTSISVYAYFYRATRAA